MIGVFISTLITRLKRQLRRPGLWLVALAAPVAAHWLVPEPGAAYAILSVNDRFIEIDAAALGLQLGVITATLLLPLAYIYLRVGSARRAPWPLIDASPHARPAYTLGTWAADTLTLWLVLMALIVAGVLLSLFRFPQAAGAPHLIALTLLVIGAPALALTAAIVSVFEARPWLRSWPGDVVFFFLWIALIVVSASPTESSAAMQPASGFADPLGFAPALANASPEPIESLMIGSGPAVSGTLKIDAVNGVLAQHFLASRVVWIGLSGLLALGAGLIFAPHRPAKARHRPAADQKRMVAIAPAMPARTAALPFMNQIVSDARLILSSHVSLALLGAAALLGAFATFRSIAGPMIFLALIFPVAAAGARWQGRMMTPLLASTGSGVFMRSLTFFVAAALVGFAAFAPATVSAIAQNHPRAVLHAVAISVATAAAAIGLGVMTKSAVPARLVLLAVWYGYLSAA